MYKRTRQENLKLTKLKAKIDKIWNDWRAVSKPNPYGGLSYDHS